MCAELLFVRGWANKDVADSLAITEQQVANYKFDFIARLRTLVSGKSCRKKSFPSCTIVRNNCS